MAFVRPHDREGARRMFAQAQDRTVPVETSAHRIYQLLRAGIRDGSITTDDQLVEHHLVREYHASRNSVRKALRLLADEGLVTRAQRVGTSPARDIVSIAPTEVGPRVWPGTAHEGRLHVTTLDCTRIPTSPELRRRLRTDAEHVIWIEQLGSFDDEPLYLRTGYNVCVLTPAEFIERLERCHVDYPPLPEAFRRIFDTAYDSSDYSVEAVAADPRVAELLDVPVHSPTLLRQLTTVDCVGAPRELSFTYFTSGRAALTGLGSFDVASTANS